ncbi:DUF4235 domain-containing protein [Cellulomonas sp. Leaf334]|uniref:DUF4235 domain-containing protein n=1 Tax=Cellulomonas sp. Leaf334 TaxID=1736339 RepID=UPI0006FB4FA1|nr:DUF4235 domain-containing protein [Cellulomonas sp. Leaf334]KQR17645.1 hypothetical protein ASF78_10370 [Cellulomonas sp. Leaf334]
MSDDQQKQSIVAKLIGAGVALAAAFVVNQVLSQAWKAKTGHKPPKAEDPGDAGTAELIAAAALTGALVAVSRVLATKSTARFVKRVDSKNPLD